MKTVCFKLDDIVYNEFRICVAGSGKTLQQFMNDLLRQYLAPPEEKLEDLGRMKDELAGLRARLDAIGAAVAQAESRIAAAQPEHRTDPPAAEEDAAENTRPEEKTTPAAPETTAKTNQKAAAQPQEKPAAKKRSK